MIFASTVLLLVVHPLQQNEAPPQEPRTTMPVFLNHFYFVPDEETYDAIKQSEFLTSGFAPWEERTTVREDMSYTGLYFYGENTYFEFVRPAADFPAGNFAIAFGVENEGGTQALAAALRKRYVPSLVRPVTREHDGAPVAWFEMLDVERASSNSKLHHFSLEYHPSFLDSWHGELAPQRRGIERSLILERYAALLDRAGTSPESIFEDVGTLILRLDQPDKGLLHDLCRAFQYPVESQMNHAFLKDYRTWTCKAPGFGMVWSAEEEPHSRIYAVELRLRRPVEHDPIDFGGFVLAFDGNTARMLFR